MICNDTSPAKTSNKKEMKSKGKKKKKITSSFHTCGALHFIKRGFCQWYTGMLNCTTFDDYLSAYQPSHPSPHPSRNLFLKTLIFPILPKGSPCPISFIKGMVDNQARLEMVKWKLIFISASLFNPDIESPEYHCWNSFTSSVVLSFFRRR